MAFIDWLKKQHVDSLKASQRMAADPYMRGMKPGANVAPAPAGAIPFQRTNPGFFARDYKKEDLVKKVMIEKNDGTKEIKSEWEERRFPVHQGNVRVSALPSEPVMGPWRELPPERANPMWSAEPLNALHWGKQNPNVPGSMGRDPGWAGVPQARAAPAPRRVQPRSSISPGAQAAIAQVQATGGQNVDASGRPISVPSIANIGMPRVADLRNRVREIERQQAAIPRQQMPPPRFVPRVDPSQFPTVQDRNTGTYNLGDPGVQMSGGFDWSGQALRENVGEDLRGVWNPIRDRLQKVLEDIRRRREGQTMAPFDWRNN